MQHHLRPSHLRASPLIRHAPPIVIHRLLLSPSQYMENIGFVLHESQEEAVRREEVHGKLDQIQKAEIQPSSLVRAHVLFSIAGLELKVDILVKYLGFFQDDDAELEHIKTEYAAGLMLAGDVKKRLTKVLREVVERHCRARAAVTNEGLLLVFMDIYYFCVHAGICGCRYTNVSYHGESPLVELVYNSVIKYFKCSLYGIFRSMELLKYMKILSELLFCFNPN